MPKISIIVPIYNEAALLPQSLPPLLALPLDKEIVAIDDGSSDASAEIIASFCSDPSLYLIRRENNGGKGTAVLAGLEKAQGKYFIIFDADSEYDPQDIIRLLQTAEDADDSKLAIYGSRFMGKNKPSFHYLVNRFLTALTNFLFHSSLTDMETCLKLVPMSALAEIKLDIKKFEIEPILTAQLLKRGYRIEEIPISYRRRSYKEGKKIRAKDGFAAIFALFKERFSKD